MRNGSLLVVLHDPCNSVVSKKRMVGDDSTLHARACVQIGHVHSEFIAHKLVERFQSCHVLGLRGLVVRLFAQGLIAETLVIFDALEEPKRDRRLQVLRIDAVLKMDRMDRLICNYLGPRDLQHSNNELMAVVVVGS